MEKSNGTLRIRAFVANEALPIEGADVLVKGADEFSADVSYFVTTDVDGITPLLILPAPASVYSLTPSPSEQPYATYDITISKDGYYTKTIKSVPVFAGIDAILPVNMIPEESGADYPSGNINAVIYENLYL